MPALLAVTSTLAQDIEPRRWTPLPVGLNVVGVGLIYSQADIAVDPALKLEAATVEVKSAVVSYLHAFDLLGTSARVDLRLPYSVKIAYVGRRTREDIGSDADHIAVAWSVRF